MSYELAELDRRLAALIQAGVVEEVDHAAARCRVRAGDWLSAMLPWCGLGAGEVRSWRPPSNGEQVLVVSPSGDPAGGFVIPGLYSSQHGGANDNRPRAIRWTMPDGCVIEYDWESGALSATGSKSAVLESSGPVTLKCASLTVEAADIAFNGNLSVDGNIRATGSVMDAGGNSNHHSH